ncbi:response regulator transcription factor [Paraburkholderia rhynchosiae]|uniref:DNA-binding response regulator n=1 Tax=Paraburkholderia rhynchosiae TaxID=487049 RepID=A0A2N7WDD2_9BURK|nr:response regulator transcription factor [Paraburkholderia rhynchosiae]PMS27426.1 DNA-binding response regulator [Paraburkholderia rhynchosiae]CAB3724715.1 Transcriptional regulatory protein CusR [Paraburkholderia rhynchosiae]
MRILLIEDDMRASRFLARGLTESGLIVDTVADGATGLAYGREGIYDVIVTDRRLPALDGLVLVQQLRAGGDTTPVLMLSAIGGLNDRVEAIRAGCDDYLVKPYAFVEALARIEALARRADRTRISDRLECADLMLDTRARTASRAGRDLRLQHREFLLLECLARRAGQVVTRSMLLEAAWHYDFEPRGNIIDMHMHRLRAKVDRDFPVALIQTVVGAGYMLNPAP